MCAGAADDTPPYRFEPPPILRAPQVARAFLGNTYAYRAQSPERPLRLTITVMPRTEIRSRFGALSGVQCINLFVDELRKVHQSFFVAAQNRPLVVAGRELAQFRWTGKRDGVSLTGVLSCGEIADRYYAIDFADALQQATQTFPRIRARLRALEPEAARAP